MKLIIAGSRSITDYETVRQAVILSGFWSKYGHNIEVVSGCANGVDKLGELFAENNGLVIHRFPADWDNITVEYARVKTNKLGKEYNAAAGAMRNIKMGNFADGLLAIWDGKSRGTKQMIEYAKSKGLEIYVHKI